MWLVVFSEMISFWDEESGTALCPFFFRWWSVMFALRQLRSCCKIVAFVCYQLCWQIRDVLWLMETSCLHRTCLCGTTAVKPLIDSVGTSFRYSLFGQEARQEVDRDSAVGIATRYGSGDWIQVGQDFPHPSRPYWRPPSLLHNGYPIFPLNKAAGTRCWPGTPT